MVSGVGEFLRPWRTKLTSPQTPQKANLLDTPQVKLLVSWPSSSEGFADTRVQGIIADEQRGFGHGRHAGHMILILILMIRYRSNPGAEVERALHATQPSFLPRREAVSP